MYVKEFTKILINKLGTKFSKKDIIAPWDTAKGSEDSFDRSYYVPRIDIAVGPFNIGGNVWENRKIFDVLAKKKADFIRGLYDKSHLGEDKEYISYSDFCSLLNPNPRCFLAIEIEKSGGTKHCLGDIANASIMGKIGIIIPLDNKKYDSFIRIKKYIHYAQKVGKLEGSFKNILIIRTDKFLK